MRKLTLDELCLRLQTAKDPVILIHKNPDGDCVGSAAALAHYFLGRGEAVSIRCADPIPARLAHLTAGLRLTPYAGRKGRTVLAVDVASPQQLGTLEDEFSGDGAPDFMIDHHEKGMPFADHYVVGEAAAAGEILFTVFRHMEQKGSSPLTLPVAEALFASISSDTGCFRFSNCTPATHMAAAHLLSLGIDGGLINHALYESKTMAEIAAEGFVASHMQTAANGRIAYAAISNADMAEGGFERQDLDTAVDIVRSLAGVAVAFVLKEAPQKNTWRVSLRSVGADVASVAAHFGGGGHKMAAGCTLADTPVDGAISSVLEQILSLSV